MSNSEREPTWLDLYDYRRCMAAIHQQRELALRAGEDEHAVLQRFRDQKDDLFARHPQSPFGPEARRAFGGLRYFPHNPALRVEATLAPETTSESLAFGVGGPHAMVLHCAGRLRFMVEGAPAELVLYWIDVYGGGLFLPFLDTTCPGESYGGGRYLFDTVKGSDFLQLDGEGPHGYEGGRVILDFNYAYNPSCAYDDRWVCPLSPRENRLAMPIRAGELKYQD